MVAATYPLQVLLLTIAGLVNRHQADVIACCCGVSLDAARQAAGPVWVSRSESNGTSPSEQARHAFLLAISGPLASGGMIASGMRGCFLHGLLGPFYSAREELVPTVAERPWAGLQPRVGRPKG